MSLEVPPARFGREEDVSIAHLMEVKLLVQKWKGKFNRLRGQANSLIIHDSCYQKPQIIQLDKAKTEDAALIPLLGGQ